MQASLSSTRSFLSSRGKFKSLHRRKKSTESTATTKSNLRSDSQSQVSLSRPISRSERQPQSSENSTRQPPVQASLAPPTSQQPVPGPPIDDVSSAEAQWNQASYDRFTEAQSEKQFVSTKAASEASVQRTSEETMKEVGIQLQPFRAPQYPSNVGLDKGLIEHDMLKSAFGITMSRGASTEAFGTDIGGTEMVKVKIPKSPGNTKDVYEMEVPLELLKGRMPELEVAISAQRDTANRSPYQGSLSPVPQSAVSAMSPTPETRDLYAANNTSTHLTVMSPLGNVQSPAPRRPFSTASLRGMANMHGEKRTIAPAIPSAHSTSTNASSEPKSLGRSYESARSSMSSVNSSTGAAKLDLDHHAATVELTPPRLDSTSLYHEAIFTRRPSRQPSRATSPFQSSPQRSLMIHRTGSSTSLRSTASNADVNKPLPPEPKRLSTISSQPSEGSSGPSRASSVTLRQAANPQRSGHIMPGSSAKTVDVGRVESNRTSSSVVSLRSKYTPKDLDALDDAFMQRNSPNKSRLPNIKSPQSSPLYMPNLASPNRSQMSFANDVGLGIISEEPMRDFRQGSVSSDVLQLSRGPMRMEPSRRAPQPPKTPRVQPNQSLYPTIEPPKAAKRSQSSNHIGSQYREQTNVLLPQRSTTLMVGSSSKADRILGKAPGSDIRGQVSGKDAQNKPWVGQRPDIQMSTQWTRSEPPTEGHFNDSASSSRLSSRDEELGPEIERSPADAHFDEIRKRLELLSPKEDLNARYQAYYQQNAHRTSDALKPEDAGTLARDIRAFTAKAAEQPREIPRLRDEQRTAVPLQPQYRPQSFLAELEAPQHQQQSASREPVEIEPVELEGSGIPNPVELGLPSPKPLHGYPNVPAPPPEPASDEAAPGIVTRKRGRINLPNPQSGLSVNSRSLHSQGSTRVRSLASLAASDIPDIYAQLGSQQNSHRPSMTSMTTEELDMLVTTETAEKVLLRILQSLDSFSDLFNAARVSRGFYRTFKRHELSLLRLSLGRMSSAAWELREMSVPFDELEEGATDYTPSLYFNHYVRDMMTMIELKALILDNCKTFLRRDTLLGLAGETERASGFDDAFWRIWSFCKIFGCDNSREDDIVGQMDWLRGGVMAKQAHTTNTLIISDDVAGNSILFTPPDGFAEGNGEDGLSAEELYDMFELWTCLGVLLQGYQGRRDQARRYGIFDKTNILQGDVEREDRCIEEWTYYLLANAPSTILDVTSVTPPTDEKLAHVQLAGHTEWVPPAEGASRSTFLKEAVSRVYEEKMALIRPQPVRSPRSFSNLPQVVTPPLEGPSSPDPFLESRQRLAGHQAELRAAKTAPTYRTIPVSTDRPMSNFNEVLSRLEQITTNGEDIDAPPMPKASSSSLAARFSRRKPKGKPSVKPMPEAASPADSAETNSLSGVREAKGNRMASLRERVTGRHSQSSSTERINPGRPSFSDKLPVSAHEMPYHMSRGPQIRDPVDVAVERLVEMGFDEAKARKALEESDMGNHVDVEKATQLLLKQRKKAARKAERLARLETMG